MSSCRRTHTLEIDHFARCDESSGQSRLARTNRCEACPIGSVTCLLHCGASPVSASTTRFCLLVEMTPEHRNTEPALRIAVGRQATPTEAEERASAGSQDSASLLEEVTVLLSRDMSDGRERNNCIEGCTCERQVGHVTPGPADRWQEQPEQGTIDRTRSLGRQRRVQLPGVG
jgi:hypothetical protein